MRIAFYDTAGLSYHATSVDSIALGGAESAACYLTRSLARTGHEIFLVTKTSEPGTYDGVRCVPHGLREQLPWGRLDAVIWMGPPVGISEIRLIAPRARFIFWSPHMPSQPVVQFLARPDGWGLFDAITMVSRWQAEQFGQKFGIPPKRMFVLRNAIGFAFERQFAPGESILPAKARPPVLAYTSTPFRGLDVLLDAFPFISAAVPGVRLKVFSSMRVYQTPAAEEAAQFGQLYARCAQTPGVEHIGSLPQPKLAAALREVSVLSYPNTFPETSCIAVMEAMASGCRIVTSELGALAETTSGFARLIRPHGTRDRYVRLFAQEAIAAARECELAEETTEQLLQRQVRWTLEHYTWAARARELVEWLSATPPGDRQCP